MVLLEGKEEALKLERGPGVEGGELHLGGSQKRGGRRDGCVKRGVWGGSRGKMGNEKM